ncbi:hypothetical protein J5X84_39330 [Streptosporangiaceae bacterium NEAU-GS5]|nr:hypothetical protein [Streptosporangiaceae bacterium NEAU-GS5]
MVEPSTGSEDGQRIFIDYLAQARTTAWNPSSKWLARRSGIPKTTVESLIGGRRKRLPDWTSQVEPLLQAYRHKVEEDGRGDPDAVLGNMTAWKRAYDDAQNRRPVVSPLPVSAVKASPRPPKPARQSHRLFVGGAILVVAAVLGAVVVYWMNTSAPQGAPVSSHTGVGTSQATTTAGCVKGELSYAVRNHDSHQYLAAADKPRMASTGSMICFLPACVMASAGSPACTTDFSITTSGRSQVCMDYAAGTSGSSPTEVLWRPCTGGASQQWFIEYHWRNAVGTAYYRIHLAQNKALCLQQASKDGLDSPLIMAECDDGWLQQWVFE